MLTFPHLTNGCHYTSAKQEMFRRKKVAGTITKTTDDRRSFWRRKFEGFTEAGHSFPYSSYDNELQSHFRYCDSKRNTYSWCRLSTRLDNAMQTKPICALQILENSGVWGD